MNLFLTSGLTSLCIASLAAADIMPIGPFIGERREPLNQSFTTIVARLSLFGGAGAIVSHDGQSTAIHLLASDTFAGDLATPRTGGRIVGFTQGPGYFEFAPPVRRFGSYWNNNSGTDDADVEFFDASSNLIGSGVATTPAPGNQWVWNGWESDTPISRIRVTGRGVIDGFLWFDDLELATVPSLPSGAVVGTSAGMALRRRRRPASH